MRAMTLELFMLGSRTKEYPLLLSLVYKGLIRGFFFSQNSMQDYFLLLKVAAKIYYCIRYLIQGQRPLVCGIKLYLVVYDLWFGVDHIV